MSAESRKAFDLYNLFRSKNIIIKVYSNKNYFYRFLLSIIYFKRIKNYNYLSDLYDGRILGVEESDINFIYNNNCRKIK